MRKSLEDIKYMVKIELYPGNLPQDIISHHVYILDSGHSIMCVLEECWGKGDPDDYELPVPVRYVLEKGYRVDGDYVIVDAPYDQFMGLDVPDEYYEYA